MIDFLNIENSEPYKLFQESFKKAKGLEQKNADAVCLSTLDYEKNEISSRFVNLKYIVENKWYFFSNYSSKKARDIEKNNQISAVLFWQETVTQVRIKAKIFKATNEFSDTHFMKRSIEKNALAISSNQSRRIKDLEEVQRKFSNTLTDLKKKESYERPKYWGGYYFIPYYFEFWEGNKDRVNKRVVFEEIRNKWEKSYLEP